MDVTPKQIEAKVIEALCTSLALEKNQIQLDSRLISDLDMDSLDFLDIMFLLETAFDTRIRDEDFDRVLRPDKSRAEHNSEFLTETEIMELAPIIPGLKESAQAGEIPRNTLFTFITVNTLVKMVSRKILRE